jgi:hypothetical protein
MVMQTFLQTVFYKKMIRASFIESHFYSYEKSRSGQIKDTPRRAYNKNNVSRK